MNYDLANKYDVAKFNARVARLLEKKAVAVLVEKSPTRSLPQNNYLHLLLGHFADVTGYSVAEVKETIFKMMDNTDIFLRKSTNRFTGETSYYLRSTAELTQSEMATAITRFRNWSSSVAGIYLPAPNELECLRSIENDLELNKKHLQQYAER